MRPIRKLLKFYHGFIIPGVLLSLSFCVVYFGIIPGYRSIRTLWDESDKLSKSNEVLRKKVRLLQSMDLATLETQRDDLLKAVPSDKQLPTIYTTLEMLAAQAGLTVNTFTIEKPGSISTESAKANIAERKGFSGSIIPLEVSLVGDTDQMRDFFARSVKIRRLMELVNVNLKFPKELVTPIARIDENNPDTNGLIEAQMSIYSFYAPLPKTLGKPSDPLNDLTPKQQEILSKISTFEYLNQDLTLGEDNIVGVKEDPFRQ